MPEQYQEEYLDEEEYVEEYDELTEEDVLAIQAEYRRKRLVESLIGPIISTVFHVALVILLAVFWVSKTEEEKAAVAVEMEEIEETKIEDPPEIEEPEEQEEKAAPPERREFVLPPPGPSGGPAEISIDPEEEETGESPGGSDQ